jgi:asparagine N-glycosylation enzyme membrane subunit Stt3
MDDKMGVILIRDVNYVGKTIPKGTKGKFINLGRMDFLSILNFPEYGTYEINERDYESTRDISKDEEEFIKKMKTISDVTYTTGPKGGFISLFYRATYPYNMSVCTGGRTEGMKIVNYLKENNLPFITIRKEKKK